MDAVKQYIKSLPDDPNDKSPVKEDVKCIEKPWDSMSHSKKVAFVYGEDILPLEKQETIASPWDIANLDVSFPGTPSPTCDNRSPVPDTPKWVLQRKRELELDDSDSSQDSQEHRKHKAKRTLGF